MEDDPDLMPEEALDDEAQEPAEPADASLRKLMEIAQSSGDISDMFSATDLTTLGSDVAEDYNRDLASRKPWEDKVKKALKSASQEEAPEAKTFPFDSASNVNYPMLTIAALQFHARAYPAVVRGDEAVLVKVFGNPPAMPREAMAAAQQPPEDENDPAQVQAVMQAMATVRDAQDAKKRHEGKLKRANRVKDFLNYTLFYKMPEWEADTDVLLLQLPIVGCAFRKVWRDNEERKHCSALVHALRLVVPMDAKSLETTPRITEEIPDVYPYQIRERQRSGQYREVDLPTTGEDEEAGRLLLEQYRLFDLDKDGVEEPYIVTVDHTTSEVLCVQANFGPDDVKLADGKVIAIKRGKFYVKYDFLPHPEGKFYGIGFGHLLEQMSAVIDTAINQLNDAATAANAGGGFIFGGLRLQGSGQTTKLTFGPGEYKFVGGPASAKDAIWERTIPTASPVTFQLLDLMLGAAKEIASIKDVLSGDAPSTAPVGTTLALIEQGLQGFTATYKRVYRSLKEEFGLIFDCMSKYADEETAQDYADVLDDPEADFAKDFDLKGMDIRPVSDPQSVTRMQKIAKGQVLLSLTGRGLNDVEIYRRALEAMDIEDVDALLPAPPQPDPLLMAKAKAEVGKIESETRKNIAVAGKAVAETETKTLENEVVIDALERGMVGMGGPADDAMGAEGAGGGGPGPAGPMEPDLMAAGAI